MSAFEEMGVMPELIRAVEEMGWLLPTPVQQEAVPLVLGGGDVLAAAETGSGKTGAFALPVLQIAHEAISEAASASTIAAKGSRDLSTKSVQLSFEDRDSLLAVSPDGHQVQSRAERSWSGGRATVGVYKGRYYFEATCCDDGLCRVGWSTKAGSLELGTDKHGFGFGGTAKKSHARQFDTYGETYGNGDVIGCMVDGPAAEIRFSKNGKDLGPAFDVPPNLQAQALYPSLCLKNAEMTLNFGKDPFRHLPPGFVGVAEAPPEHAVSESDIAAGPKPGGGKGASSRPRALILEPARDLAEQTHRCIVAFGKHLRPPVRSVLLVGGVDAGAQAKACRDGVDVVTGTPLRVLDFVESGKIDLSSMRFFVLDEADRLLDTGNQESILKLWRRFPKQGAATQRLQTLMFSATLHSPEIKALAEKLCQRPTWVDLKGKDSVPETVDHALVVVSAAADNSWGGIEPRPKTDNIHAFDNPSPTNRSPESMSEGVKRLKCAMLHRLIDKHDMSQCLIFCRTNFDCENVEDYLTRLGGGRAFRGRVESGKENPYSCCVLAGAKSMQERRDNLQAFKEGDVRFLICTDVAARGLDIKELPYVINMTLPDKDEDYIHRVGRVGRADVMGLAISIVAQEKEKVWYCSVKGYKPWFSPKRDDVAKHTIWYDEMALVKDIEKRLKHPIQRLGKNLDLPQGTKAGTTVYGQMKGGGLSKVVSEHAAQLRPSVESLAAMEVQAQTSFLSMWRTTHTTV